MFGCRRALKKIIRIDIKALRGIKEIQMETPTSRSVDVNLSYLRKHDLILSQTNKYDFSHLKFLGIHFLNH